MHARTTSPAAPPAVRLSPLEHAVCRALHDAATHINTDAAHPPVALRIAGGWVRDKLLGLASSDIDVAVDTMTGYALATRVVQFIEEHGGAAAYGVAPDEAGHSATVAKIASNPDKSKHLETATTWLFGLQVDFVNLRSDTYTNSSRIPTVAFGTPKDDAYRRDLTINALFYHIHTRQVEDWTGMGLQDLHAGVVRTPLPPRDTFLDDPLRMLRVVRFATRYAFAIDPDALACMSDPSIHAALVDKVSRERMGAELSKMLAGPDPARAIDLLHDTQLAHAMFASYGTIEDDAASVRVAQALDALLHVASDELRAVWGIDREWRRNLFLAALVYHTRDQTCHVKNKALPLPLVLVRDGIKLSSTDAARTAHLLADIAFLHRLLDQHAHEALDRVVLGKAIRRLAHQVGIKAHWRLCLVFAAAVDLACTHDVSCKAAAMRLLAKYTALLDHATELGIAHCDAWKYLVDGKELARLYGLRPSPRIRDLLEDEVMAWQLRHPDGTVEACRQHLAAMAAAMVTRRSADPQAS